MPHDSHGYWYWRRHGEAPAKLPAVALIIGTIAALIYLVTEIF